MSAIDRLRENCMGGAFRCELLPDAEPCDNCKAVAAVDALHQAAKPLDALVADLDVILGLGHALRNREPEVRQAIMDAAREVAAAVSLVEGTASPQETARRVEGT